MRVSVVGAGPVGRASAAFLAQRGHEASLWSPSGAGTAALARVAGRSDRVRLRATGAVRGEFEIGIVASPGELAGAEVVLIALPAHAYHDVLARVVPHLHAGQTVIVSGALSLVPLWIYERAGMPGARPLVVSWGTTLATARRAEGFDVEVNTLRARFEIAAVPASRIDTALELCRALFGERFRPVDNQLVTALSNVNPVAHAAEALPNLTRMERGEHWYLFDCMTPAAARIAEAIDLERLAIARALGCEVRSLVEHYHLSYHVPRGSVAEIAAAIHARDGQPPGPKTLEHRYLIEDMPFGLAFYESLARSAGVTTPVLSAALTIASIALGRDFRRQNPILADLAIESTAPAALIARCAG